MFYEEIAGMWHRIIDIPSCRLRQQYFNRQGPMDSHQPTRQSVCKDISITAMKEWKRIFGSAGWLAVLLLLFVGGILFFLKLQREQNPVSIQEYRRAHAAWQARLADLPAEAGISQLEAAQEELQNWGMADYLLRLQSEDPSAYQRQVQSILERRPNLAYYIERLQAGESAPGGGAQLAVERWKARLQYISSYAASLEQIERQAESMKTISIFSDPDSFAYRNIEKTVQDFSAMHGQTLIPGNDEVVLSVLQDRTIPLCSLLLVLATVLLCLDERRRNLRNAVYATAGGRGHLALWRFGALALTAVVGAVIFFGGKLVVSMWFYGASIDGSRLIQSIEAFRYFPVPMSVGWFLALYALLHVLGVCLMGLLLWAVLSYLPRNLGLILSAAFLCLEYYWFITLKSYDALPWLRSVNLFTFASMEPVFSRYINYEIFGHLIWEPVLVASVQAVLLAGCAAACVFGQVRRRPKEQARFSQWCAGLRLRSSRKGCGLAGAEWRKSWITSKGLLVLAAFLLFAWTQITLPQQYLEQKDALLKQYYQKYQGPVTQETMDQINQEVTDAFQQYEELVSQLQGEGLPEQILSSELSFRLARVQALEELSGRAQALWENGDDSVWLLGEFVYENVFGESSLTWRVQNQSVSLLAIILLLTPIFGYETHSRTRTFLQTLPDGRGHLHRAKILLAAGAIFLIWLAGSAREWQLLAQNSGGYPGWQASGLSLAQWAPSLRHAPIALYLAVLYLCRLVGLLSAGMVVLLISNCVAFQTGSIAVSIVVLLLPAFLASLPGAAWLAPISWPNQLAGIGMVPQSLYFVGFGAIGGVTVWLSGRRWRRYRA